MRKGISIASVLSVLLLSCSGCGNTGITESGSSNSGSLETSPDTSGQVVTESVQTDTDMFTDRDYETDYDETGSVLIQLNGSSATASSGSVQISGTTITITEEATYVISGTLDNGMIIVNAPDTAKLQLVLNGAEINSATSAALYILEADKVFVTLADGTENNLSNGGTFTAIDTNNIDSVIFSKQDLTLNGSGSLMVTSPAGHGIVSKDDLVITGGTYTIACAFHGLDANDSVRITGETSIEMDAGKDGIHVENEEDTSLGFVYISNGTLEIEAEGDGISAGAYLQIENGTFQILAGGGSENGSKASSDSWGGFQGPGRPGQYSYTETTTDDSSTSMKGMKSTGNLLITNGSFTVDAADDAVHSNASLTVNGGVFEIATGDDAFHAEENLTVTEGQIHITESYEGLEALNIDIQGGDITLVSSDDGLNAAGGTMHINACGDGIDANGTLTISGGYVVVSGPTQGDTATLDYDVSGVITGGTFIGTGASGMAQTFSDSEQGVIAVRAGNQSAGTTITITDQDGNTLVEYTPELSFDVIIFSSPELVSGDTYTVTTGSVSFETEAK